MVSPDLRLHHLFGCVLMLTTFASLGVTQARNYSVVHVFAGTDGSFPAAGLVADGAGNLYGTAHYGGGGCGGSGCGTVFKVTPDGTTTVLYSFAGASDGGLPVSNPRLTMDSKGNLYGTTFAGGLHGYGVVFELSPSGGTWTERPLYSFASGSDGANPWGAPIFDSKGNLYGTTTAGGTFGYGTVYMIDSRGEKVVHSFGNGTDGQFPPAGLVAYKGNFYGTTQSGGANDDGTVFEITPPGVETVLYSFTDGNDGANPEAALLADNRGNLFGTTSTGSTCGYRCITSGAVFELSQSNGAWTFTTLYTFVGGNDGSNPHATLIADSKGNLYGTTRYGGSYGNGTVFKLAPDGTETVLRSFKGYIPHKAHLPRQHINDGALPFEGVTIDTDGYLYGTTTTGGSADCDQFAAGCGVIFRVEK